MKAAELRERSRLPARPDAGGSMRLLAQGLSDQDLRKVSSFLRIGQERLRASWSVVEEGDVHVLLTDGEEITTISGISDEPVIVLSLADAAAGSGLPSGTLRRPLEYEALLAALHEAERRVLGDAAAAPAPALAAATALPAVAPMRALPYPTNSSVPPAIPRDAAMRLTRWPSSDLLRRSRYNIRLATFLSTRFLGFDELLRLSNVPRPDCESFLALVQAAGLVRVQAAESPGGAAIVEAAAASRAASSAGGNPPGLPAPARPDAGLLSRIRQRLGLGSMR